MAAQQHVTIVEMVLYFVLTTLDDFLVIVLALLKIAHCKRAPGNGPPGLVLFGSKIVDLEVIIQGIVGFPLFKKTMAYV